MQAMENSESHPKETFIERFGVAQALAGNEALLRNILNSASDAIITIDNRHCIVLFNSAAETMFVCSRQQVIGSSIREFFPQRLRPLLQARLQSPARLGSLPDPAGNFSIDAGLRANGEEFPLDGSLSQVCDHGRKFFTLILRDLSLSVQAARALQRSQQELRQFAAAAHSVREQEKSRIARELHDELGQALTALKMDIGWLQARCPSHAAVKLHAMSLLLDDMVTATRRIAADLRPLLLDDLGLNAAAEWLVQNFSRRSGIECRLHLANPDAMLPDPYATAIFRILQESLNNVAKHAQASEVTIRIAQTEKAISICVEDNGVGFMADAKARGSHGLLGVRERAYSLGGLVTIQSAPGQGTKIAVDIPLDAPQHSQAGHPVDMAAQAPLEMHFGKPGGKSVGAQ